MVSELAVVLAGLQHTAAAWRTDSEHRQLFDSESGR